MAQRLRVQATLDQPEYLKRLGLVWLVFFSVLGIPIAAQTFDPMEQVWPSSACCWPAAVRWQAPSHPACPAQPIQFFLSSTMGALFVVVVAITRIWLGWAYVGNRLLSAAVDYEESGWCAALSAVSGT